jgi:hypothetical protein
VIELYVDGQFSFTVGGLSGYNLWRSTDGAAFASGADLASQVWENEFVYIFNSGRVSGFDAIFGTSGDFANRMFYNNVITTGNDGFQIRETSTGNILDQVWKADSTNVYTYSYMYRKDGTGPNVGGGYNAADWIFGGNNLLGDGTLALTPAQQDAAIPFGTYQVPEPATLVLLGVGSVLLRKRK